MSDKPVQNRHGRRQLAMLLPIKGGVASSNPSVHPSEDEMLRQAMLLQLEKFGLRASGNKGD